MRLTRLLPSSIAALCASLLGLAAPLTAGAAPAVPAVRDYLVMDVCVDAQDRPVPGLPTQCARHRDVREGESVNYFVADWPEAGDSRCFAKEGYVRRYSLPLTNVPSQGGPREVIISVLDRGGSEFKACSTGCNCRGPQKPVTFGHWDGEHDGISVLSYGADYAHIMASKAQTKSSYFLGSACARADARGIDRFGPTWVISSVGLPPKGGWQFGEFASRLSVNTIPAPQAGDKHRTSFVAWTRADFAFGPASQLKLDAIVSDKYANAGDQSPGEAEQMERSYWTREFGITRWEKWERVDHERRDKRSGDDQARRIHDKNVCGKPYGAEGKVSPHLTYGAVTDDGSYRRDVVQVGADGRRVRSTWHLVDCADWTNAREQAPFQPTQVWNQDSIREILQVLR
jgi:hypothetical protein